MSDFQLILYTRRGCCLCEGLEKRLKSLSLDQLSPPLQLQVIDIDDHAVPGHLRASFDNEVPVLVLLTIDQNHSSVLPRVSPRLKEEGLSRWLQRNCTKVLGLN